MRYIKSIRKEYVIACIILLLPLSIASVSIFPHYEEFIIPGEIVPVQEIGVQGHVHFVYVHSGYTENWFDKLMLSWQFKDRVEFRAVDKEEVEFMQAWAAFAEEEKIDTLETVLSSVAQQTDSDEALEMDLVDRLQEILGNIEDYEGDSFGLMLALGLVEEATGEDFTQGDKYLIAGTGALEEDQTVGSVGAIRQKLHAAQAQQVDYFFIPQDKDWYVYEGLSNQEEAEMIMREESLGFQLVPVQTLDEALLFLRGLP